MVINDLALRIPIYEASFPREEPYGHWESGSDDGRRLPVLQGPSKKPRT
jgi:hypothetical protein